MGFATHTGGGVLPPTHKRRDDRYRQEILDELAREASALGMYDS